MRLGTWLRLLLVTVATVTAVQLAAAPGEQASGTGDGLLGLDAYVPAPQENPVTPAKVSLGRRLFFDTTLSRDGKTSCASCHDPDRAFTDGRPVSIGVFARRGTRNTPTLVNRAWGKSYFWDGRTPTLEEQVTGPIEHPEEMDLPLPSAVLRLRQDAQFVRQFQSVFGADPDEKLLARALASYVRTILSGASRFDHYQNGRPETFSTEERSGLELFRGKANCVVCHSGPNLTDELFHNTGVAWRDGRMDDPGRAAITGRENDRGAFKTPTLREIAQTGPYMHDGNLKTLREVVGFYDRGGSANPQLDAEIKPLRLHESEKRALIAFLESLSGIVMEGSLSHERKRVGNQRQHYENYCLGLPAP